MSLLLIDRDEAHNLLTVAKNFLDYKHESVSRGDIEGVKIAEQLFELTLTELLRRLGTTHLILRWHSVNKHSNSFTL